METKKLTVPKDGFAGFKEYFKDDAISGFIVFLLALPLSLGIAKASDFPAIMGLVTAMIGGLVVTFFAGSRLTIKGPAAGLIVIAVGAVADFGGGETGWHLALGAAVVAGVFQVLFGIFKLGKLTDIFPLSAVHGMLAAIGLIIIVKQIPVLLDVDPGLAKGKGPIELVGAIPSFIMHLDPRATIIGVISLLVMLFWGKIKTSFLRFIPAPLIVLLFSIPAELMMDFQHSAPPYALVKVGNLMEHIKWNVDFSGIHMPMVFIKYVILFAIVGSLESLLTVKAVDMMDPYKRKSDSNKDMIAIGIGNILSSILGGLPMISEVARSSSNVNNGAKTRWANFYHGLFIFIFVLFAVHLIELIPNTALAAMLISVGIKLAHPREFLHMAHIGKDQLLIFIVTIFFTLYEDLLVGIAAGMVLKIILHLINGAPLKSLFKAHFTLSQNGDDYLIVLDKAAIFTNYIGLSNQLNAIPSGSKITIDAGKVNLIDHSVLENIQHFQQSYLDHGGTFQIIGLDQLKPYSAHELAARKKIKPTSI